MDHSIEADKDGSTVTLLDIMGQQDDNYDLTEKRMILERILPILSERKDKSYNVLLLKVLAKKRLVKELVLVKCMFHVCNVPQ